MTLADFKRNLLKEFKLFYKLLVAMHYIKKAEKHLHTDVELSKAYAKLAEIYGNRSKGEGQ